MYGSIDNKGSFGALRLITKMKIDDEAESESQSYTVSV